MSRFFFVKTVRLGRIFGIGIEVDYSWFFIFALVFFSLAFEFFPALYSFSVTTNVVVGFITTLLFFSSVLTHELAHSIIANRNGVIIKKIILFIFGGVASLTHEPNKPNVELKIAVAGPLTSIILSGLFFVLSYVLQYVWLPIAVGLQYLSIINLALAIFNLIPGYPLDGGRILRALLWKRLGLERSTIIAARFGMAVGYLIVLFGIFQLLYLGNFFGLVWFSLIGFFLISAARESVLQVRLMTSLAEVRVSDLMSIKPIVVSSKQRVRDFVEEILLGRKQLAALVRQDARIVGEISVDMVRKVPVERLGSVSVGEVMRPYATRDVLRPTMLAAKALQLLAGSGFERLPVIDRGRLIGVVSRDDIRVYLSVRTDLLNAESRLHSRV
jgi:Zn-dependent protease/predicted transcriptional regulator